jgi:hypothetical protein
VANLNKGTPIARTTPLKGLTVRQTNDGTVVAPNSVGLRSVDTDDGALRYGAKGLRVHRPSFGMHNNRHRVRLTHGGRGPRRAWRERQDQSAARPRVNETIHRPANS